MSYYWNDVDENDFEKLPIGRQVLRLFCSYESQNSNGNPFLMFKFCKPDETDFSALDDNGRPRVYPHANLNVYYEARENFGLKVLKQLLKHAFDEKRLESLTENDLIIHTINKEKPLVSTLVYFDEKDYCRAKEFAFENVDKETVDMFKPDDASADREKRAQLAAEEQQTEEGEKTKETVIDDSDDLPF